MDHRNSSQPLMPEGQAMLSGPAREALREAAMALDIAERFHQPLEMSLALAQMARCYRALQALAPAVLCLERALGWAYTSFLGDLVNNPVQGPPGFTLSNGQRIDL